MAEWNRGLSTARLRPVLRTHTTSKIDARHPFRNSLIRSSTKILVLGSNMQVNRMSENSNGNGMLSSARYHNYEQFITQWTDDINNGNGSALLKDRPRPIGMLYDNTTVVGSWIHEQNITALSQKFSNRIINNVSMAMPHAGVFSAARDPLNDILQPQDLSVSTRGSVPLHPSSSSLRVWANIRYEHLFHRPPSTFSAPMRSKRNLILWSIRLGGIQV